MINDLAEKLEQEEDRDIIELEKDPALGEGLAFDLYSPFRIDSQTTDSLEWDKFLKKINGVPVLIRNLITSADTVEFLIIISEQFDLSAEESASLARIIRDVLLADIFLGDFPMLISQKLGVDGETANQIAQKIVSELFAPAIEDIKNTQREKFADRIAQSRGGQPPPGAPPVAPSPRRPAGFVRPDERVQGGNVVDLRNRENQ